MPGRAPALAALLTLVLAGCATGPGRPPPPDGGPTLSRASAAELVRRWEDEWAAFTGLRAAVDVSVTRRGKSERTGALLLLSPVGLRLEVSTPFGLPALVVVATADELTVYRPLERRALTGRPTPEAVSRWLGAPVPIDTLLRVLNGGVPPPPDPDGVGIESGSAPYLAFQQGSMRHRVWVNPQGQPERLLLEDAERLVVTFGRAVTGNLQELRLEAPARSTQVTVRYISAEYVTPPASAFVLQLPSGIRIDRVD